VAAELCFGSLGGTWDVGSETLDGVRVGLFAFGYPVSIAVIVRWVPVVRERRIRWFVLHQLAVAAIVIGWSTESAWSAVLINGAWLVIATAWYAAGGQRPGPA